MISKDTAGVYSGLVFNRLKYPLKLETPKIHLQDE